MSDGDTEELIPASAFRDGDETTQYWLADGIVMHRDRVVKGAHAASFRFFRGGFAKDHAYAYSVGTRLAGARAPTFRALNYAYATDGVSVWTLGGKIDEANAATFAVCDSGVREVIGSRLPYGFAKDDAHVFYYDYQGKTKLVRKATAAEFVSLGDGFFGKDDTSVYFGASALPKAVSSQWRTLGRNYSCDAKHVWYGNRLVNEADVASFEVVSREPGKIPLARDAHHWFKHDGAITLEEFERLLG